MTLRDVLNILKRGIALIIILPVLCAGAVGIYAYRFMADYYTSSTTLYILISQDQEVSSLNSSYLSANMSVSEQIANDVAELIMSNRAQLLVEEYAGEDVPPYSVSAYCGEDSRILTISVMGYDRDSLEDVANSLAKVAAELAHNIMNVESINVIDWATTPRGPSGPNRTIYVLAAGAAGLFSAVVILLLAAKLDTRVRTVRDAERASGLPGVGRIPLLRISSGKVGSERRAADVNAVSVADARDAIQTALTSLFFLSPAKQPRVLVVSSPSDEEGRSTLACLAAQTLAASGNSVLLMEGDLNNRSLAELLGVYPERGISAVLSREATLLEAVRRTHQSNLYFLDAESDISNPTGFFSSKEFKATLKLLRKKYDFVVIDTPPSVSFIYASVLASYADATLVLAREGSTRKAELRAGSDQLMRAGVSLAGVLLNCSKLTREERRKIKKRIKKRKAKEGAPSLAGLAMKEDVIDAVCPPVEEAEEDDEE